MKRKTKSLILGLCLALSLAAATIPAEARNTTGFAGFRVDGPNQYKSDPYHCLTENYGAVVNNCGFSVSIVYDMPVDNTGTHWISAVGFWGYSGDYYCQPWAYDGNGGGWSGPAVYFSPGYRGSEGTWNTYVPTYSNGESITLYCVLPNGAGIANVNWSQ